MASMLAALDMASQFEAKFYSKLVVAVRYDKGIESGVWTLMPSDTDQWPDAGNAYHRIQLEAIPTSWT